jgi:hypothetical protein
VTLVVFVDQLFEVGEFFGGEEEGFGVDAGFEGIHGRGGFACGRGGAGGFLRVATVGFDLADRGHMDNSEGGTGKDACPTLTIKHEIRGIRREYL